MEKSCAQCSEIFTIRPSHEAFYAKMGVGIPLFCPLCRMRRRLVFRNDRSLYQAKSALSGKPIISMYNPEYEYVVFDEKEWWSDDWDALSYGRNFDFSRPFFEQFTELQKVVPRFNLYNKDSENSNFVNYAPHCKNCYLMFGCWFSEDCLYGQTLNECQNCVDNLFLERSQLCYENIDCSYNYRAFFCQNSSNVQDSYFCFDCKNVNNVIGCWNLRNKEYHIFNQPVSKEQFEEEKKKLLSPEYLLEVKNRFADSLKTQAIHKNMNGTNNENVSGDFIFNSKNAELCFSIYRSEDVAFVTRCIEAKDSFDIEAVGKSELCYENMSNDFSYRCVGCTTSEHLNDSHYCDLCYNCSDCFGCIGLKQKKYCILNKQYTKEEYDALVPKIVAHMKRGNEWGEFFPMAISTFAYNETMAQEYAPLTKEQVTMMGAKWKDESAMGAQGGKINPEISSCTRCQRNFKIIPKEVQFYREQYLPMPVICSDCRHKNRMAMRNPRQLWNRVCGKCGQDIETSYAPERSEKVYCEPCYLREVY